ncbi:MAG TPA: DUF4097 family beta strand repeat-containing protein [Dehalococcoidia bacterium]|nr:DUF4097 family beta strand repeat-containing protein [Dehalococcoidia bacterium]
MGARFALPAGAALRVLAGSGRVTVVAEDRSDLEVDPPDRRVDFTDHGRTAEVRSRSGSLDVRCPRGTDVSVGAISGQVQLRGQFGSVKVSAVSGQVEVDSASGDVDVRAVSGHLTVETCGGRCHLTTKSGHIRIGSVGGPAHASTISGQVEIGTSGGGEVEVKTVSGRITVRVPRGKHPRVRLRSLSGRLRCDCPQGSDFDINATSISGSLEVTER